MNPAHAIGAALDAAASFLAVSGVPEARVDAEVLLAAVLRCGRLDLVARSREQIPERDRLQFNRFIARRGEKREPVAYILEWREFHGLDLKVTPSVLIPRPETELLVELAIAAKPARVADLGTGSGCIAAALAKALPGSTIVATDSSPAALRVARRNLPESVEVRKGDLLEPLGRERYDLIVSNPPYVADADYEGLEPELKHEPKEALLAGPDGLAVVRRLLAGFKAHAPRILVEIGAGQAGVLRREFPGVVFHKDLAGIERVADLC